MSDSCKWCDSNLDFVSKKPFEQRKIGDTEECEACVVVPCVSVKNQFSSSVCKDTPENRLETPTSAVFKRFVKRLLAYEPSQHDLLVLLFRIATNEGGYTESDLVYLVDKIFSDRDVDAEDFEGEVQDEPEVK